MPIVYEGITVQVGLRVDLVVNDDLLVEVKAVEDLHPIHEAQLLTYLRMTGKTLGLLINFNERRLHHGLRRVVCTSRGTDETSEFLREPSAAPPLRGGSGRPG